MGTEVSPEPIDFDFFADEDENDDGFVRNSRRRESPLTTTPNMPKQSNVIGSRRPESASSTRSAASCRSSINIKLPSAGPTGDRENSYTFKGRYSDSSDEEYLDKLLPGHAGSDRYQPRKNDERVERNTNEQKSQRETSLSRPKTSRGRRSHKRHDSSSSHGSSSTHSSKSDKSLVSLKSEQSDSYTSISNSESDDVTDVSPLLSPARSSTPVLDYDQDDFEDSFEENKFREAKLRPRVEHSRRDGKNNQRRAVKEGVRFAGVTPGNRPSTQRDKQLDETEARELSRLLQAVLELDETPNSSQLQSFQRSLSKQRPTSAKNSLCGPTAEALPHHRVNLSFSNDKVKEIDRENQRLLQKILKRPKTSYTGSASPSVRRWDEPAKMVSHSAICRQREQRKIEMENMKILQRIEAAQACSSVQRDKLLKEHSKQMKYASQVSKGAVRPQSSRPYNYRRPGSMSKGSSTTSLNSTTTHSSTRSAGSRKHGRPSSGRSAAPPPRSARQAWDHRW